MDDTPTTLLVAESDEGMRDFQVDHLLADGFAACGAGSLKKAHGVGYRLSHAPVAALAEHELSLASVADKGRAA